MPANPSAADRQPIPQLAALARPPGADLPAKAVETPVNIGRKEWEELRRRLAWQYPYVAATRQAAKIRVSEFSRRAAERPDEEAWPVVRGQRSEIRGQKSEDGSH